MNPLVQELDDVLCPGMHIPDELRRLYDWIGANAPARPTQPSPAATPPRQPYPASKPTVRRP